MPHIKTKKGEVQEAKLATAAYNEALAIRYEVFVEEQAVPLEEEVDKYESEALHYLLLSEGQPVGAGRWRRTPKGIKIERMALRKSYRNQGLGAYLLQKMLAAIEIAEPRARIYLHAQEAVLSFYRRAGFRATGSRFYECEIPHFLMYKP